MKRLILTKASEIELDPIGGGAEMDHEQYVHEDASRIFERMMSESEDDVSGPDMYVLYSPMDLERLPPVPAVYIGFNEHGRCQYVGESGCVGRRIGRFGDREQLIYCKYIAVVLAEDERDLRRLEMYYIGLLDPVYNKQIRPRGKNVRCYIDDIEWDAERRMWRKNGSSCHIDRNGNLHTFDSRRGRGTRL